MKTLIGFFCMINITLAAEPLTLKLEFRDGGDSTDYAAQIQVAFAKVLAADPSLSKQFARFEAPPREDARGRYSGEPTIQPMYLGCESHATNDLDGRRSDTCTETIALYYRFDQGKHRGWETLSGFFALFTVLEESSRGEDGVELIESNVVATFQGFSRTLVAPEPDKQNQAEQDAPGDDVNPATR